MGFCHACGARDPLVEAPRPRRGEGPWAAAHGSSVPLQLSDVSLDDTPRILLPYAELNRVLGGGLVPGSILLMAGDPGIGKSTLLLQIAAALAPKGRGRQADAAQPQGGVLYVSGEESAAQVRMRAERLGIDGHGLYLLGETDVAEALRWMDNTAPAAVIVDSIQTLYTEDAPSSPGSVAQVRECTRLLLGWAKARQTPVLLSGHVTKEGDVAGPRVLEHMVDVVLYLEGESLGPYRVVRSVKNRFGSTDEVALFQMQGNGLSEVEDPSQALLSQRQGPLVGAIVCPVVQGSRPLLVEVQALTSPAVGPVPRRVANGLETNRLTMLAAVLSRRAGLPLGGQDIIVNVAGGLRVSEPATDLATALAIASAFRNQPLAPDLVALGEVGLSGEIRPVPQMGRRLQEAARLRLRRAIGPMEAARESVDGIAVTPVSTLSRALTAALPKERGRARADAGSPDDAED